MGSRKSDCTRSATNSTSPRSVHAVEEDRELVAAKTGEDVTSAQARRKLVRDGREELVADQVTEAVVDQLEAIDVNEQHRVAIVTGALRPREDASELLHERGAVRKIRERIVPGRMFQARLRLVAIGDIGLRSGEPRRRAVRIAYGDAAAQHPSVRTGGRLDPMFVFEVGRIAGEMRAKGRAKPFDFVGMHPVQPVQQACCPLRLRRGRASSSNAARSTRGFGRRPSPRDRRLIRQRRARSAPRSVSATAASRAACLSDCCANFSACCA